MSLPLGLHPSPLGPSSFSTRGLCPSPLRPSSFSTWAFSLYLANFMILIKLPVLSIITQPSHYSYNYFPLLNQCRPLTSSHSNSRQSTHINAYSFLFTLHYTLTLNLPFQLPVLSIMTQPSCYSNNYFPLPNQCRPLTLSRSNNVNLHILMHTHSYLPYITRLPCTCLSNFPYFQSWLSLHVIQTITSHFSINAGYSNSYFPLPTLFKQLLPTSQSMQCCIQKIIFIPILSSMCNLFVLASKHINDIAIKLKGFFFFKCVIFFSFIKIEYEILFVIVKYLLNWVTNFIIILYIQVYEKKCDLISSKSENDIIWMRGKKTRHNTKWWYIKRYWQDIDWGKYEKKNN